jgi:hypothetical protein
VGKASASKCRRDSVHRRRAFVGNRLAAGKVVTSQGGSIDLRNIKSPIIVFCSFGDDISPPQQALDWILDLYQEVEEIIANGQTIIYSLHQSIGHLGIFVSGKVAKKEHEEFTFNVNLIDVMPPGLYELVLTDADESVPRADLVEGKYITKLEPRTMDDVRALGCNSAADQRRFETVARVSDFNQGLYRMCVRLLIKSLTTEASAEILREIHPNRVAFRAYFDQNPVMAPVATAAEKIRSDGHPVEPDNPLLALEEMASGWIITNLDFFAKIGEAIMEATFLGIYGSPLLRAAVELRAAHADAECRRHGFPTVIKTREEPEAAMLRGGFLEAASRALLYVSRGKGADERQFNAIEALRNCAPENERVSLPQVKEIMRHQAALLRFDQK